MTIPSSTKTQPTKTPQQQSGNDRPAPQMGTTEPQAPQQGQAPVIRDWASI